MIAVMDELGIDMKKHRAQSFDDLEDTSFDVVVSLSPEAHHRALEMTRTMAIEAEYWPTFDPSVIARQSRADARCLPGGARRIDAEAARAVWRIGRTRCLISRSALILRRIRYISARNPGARRGAGTNQEPAWRKKNCSNSKER